MDVPNQTGYEVPSTDLLTAKIGSWSWISGGEPDFTIVRNDQPGDEPLFDVRRGSSFPYEDSKAYHRLSVKDDLGPCDFLLDESLPGFFDILKITSMTGRIETGDTEFLLYSIEYTVDLQYHYR